MFHGHNVVLFLLNNFIYLFVQSQHISPEYKLRTEQGGVEKLNGPNEEFRPKKNSQINPSTETLGRQSPSSARYVEQDPPDQPGEDRISYTVRARVILEPHDGTCAAGIGLLELERERWFGPGQVKAQLPHP